ncbi:MAG: hypothetical protein BIFFINMI_01377 [Phycisphaerae bacterium]|nr:hypothetical protein [Phycisphaerae bacterium]
MTDTRRSRLTLLLAALALPLLGGCQGMGFIAQALQGDTIVQPVADLSKGRLLVLVDETVDQMRTPTTGTIRRDVEQSVRTELADRRHDVVNANIIKPDEVNRLQARYATARDWSPTRLGRELQATRVLHVTLGRYQEPDPVNHVEEQGRLTAFVKVFDVETGDQVWPIEDAGEEIVFEDLTARGRVGDPTGELPRQLAEGLGKKIARLFYKHTISASEEARTNAEGVEK